MFLACAHRETDAGGQFAEHKRSELLEVKPRAILAEIKIKIIEKNKQKMRKEGKKNKTKNWQKLGKDEIK